MCRIKLVHSAHLTRNRTISFYNLITRNPSSTPNTKPRSTLSLHPPSYTPMPHPTRHTPHLSVTPNTP